ncbi:hypothetical protein [Thalassobacillus hwangdonensis]|uniref:Uncharacterized protein n=1 Tax=Thalassobacillus hwangdonensis TaxID=546108 RepID=A0ABW3L068_9BACI
MTGIFVLILLCALVFAGAHAVVKHDPDTKVHPITNTDDYFVK